MTTLKTLDARTAERIEKVAAGATGEALEQAIMHALAAEYPEASDAEVEGMAADAGLPTANVLLEVLHGCGDSEHAAVAALLALLEYA
jgi:hypothetical protein